MQQAKHIDIQGHRGARGLFPENTIPAFIEAVRLGVNTLELDVIISKDAQVVVSHEPWMNEAFYTKPDGSAVEPNSKNKYNLYKMNYTEIKSYDCGLRTNPEFPQQRSVAAYKPLLAEVIEKVEAYTKEKKLLPVNYNIEIKSEAAYDGIFNPDPKTFVRIVYQELQRYTIFDRIILQSFDVRILQEIKKINPAITISLLVENTYNLETNLAKLGFNPDIYGPEFILIDDKLVSELKRKNIKLIPWTVNEISDMQRLVDMGVDGLITDYPDRAIALLGKQV